MTLMKLLNRIIYKDKFRRFIRLCEVLQKTIRLSSPGLRGQGAARFRWCLAAARGTVGVSGLCGRCAGARPKSKVKTFDTARRL